MTIETSFRRTITAAAAALTGLVLLAGCDSPERVTRTTTSEQTTNVPPPPVTSSTTTTTTQQTQP